MDVLAAYFQIKVAEVDQQKTTFMLHSGRYFCPKTVMGNLLSSDTWLKASDEVIKGLDGVFKLINDLLIGGRNFNQLAERVEALMKRCQEAGMTGKQQGPGRQQGDLCGLHHCREHPVPWL